MITTITPRQPLRRSADHVWPLRDATGRTWAERKAADAAQPHPLSNSSPRT